MEGNAPQPACRMYEHFYDSDRKARSLQAQTAIEMWPELVPVRRKEVVAFVAVGGGGAGGRRANLILL